MRLYFWSYSMKSSVARTIAHRLGGRLIKHVGSRYVHRSGDIIVNWGASHVPYPVSLNLPQAVSICCSKMRSYSCLQQAGIPTCEWTTSPADAKRWYDQGHDVYARSRDCGARGEGISVIQAYDHGSWEEQLANASATGDIRFFTKRIRNNREFRVYLVGERITTILEKRQRIGTQASEFVRSHGNNWVFARTLRAPVPDSMLSNCKAALRAIGLDFAGIDVVLDLQGNPVILEVNSAPGVDAPTAQTEFVSGLTALMQDRFGYVLPAGS